MRQSAAPGHSRHISRANSLTPAPAAAPTWHLLEERKPFAQSLLWDWQRRYFAQAGVDAWRQGPVPHYITNNPRMADSYAEIVFGFLRDRDRLAGAATTDAEPLHLLELGAGSGRFAFHFLRRLGRLCELGGVAPGRFRYVLTDVAERTVRFWREHPRLQPFLAAGLLEVAVFDLERADAPALLPVGGSLAQPLVVIANYVFDSIPQELFHLDRGECRPCLVSLAVDADPATLDAATLLERVQCRYERGPAAPQPAFAEPWLQELLAGYQRALTTETHLLFPAAALRCLERLRGLSRQGLLLLTADKGDHRLVSLQRKPPPGLVRHGCFSLSVNYHAIKSYCERRGGLAMFPGARHASLDVGACLLVADAADHRETRLAYERHVRDFGPDDFYTVAAHARRTIGQMSVEDLLAYLRLGHYDAHQFARYLPRLLELAPRLERDQHRALNDAIDRVWDLYYPLGEEGDLADAIARLLYEMNDYRRALEYFGRSLELSGAKEDTLANLAACRQLLGREEQAAHSGV